jgi:hypothetical protein
MAQTGNGTTGPHFYNHEVRPISIVGWLPLIFLGVSHFPVHFIVVTDLETVIAVTQLRLQVLISPCLHLLLQLLLSLNSFSTLHSSCIYYPSSAHNTLIEHSIII